MTPLELNPIGAYILNSSNYTNNQMSDLSGWDNHLDNYGVAPTFTTRDTFEVLDIKTDSYLVGKSLLVTDSTQILVMHKNTSAQVLNFLRFDTYPVANGNHLGAFDDTIKDWTSITYRRHNHYAYNTLHRFFQQSVGTNVGVTTPTDAYYIVTVKYTSNPDTIQIALNDGAFVSASISNLQSIGNSSIMSFGLQGVTFTSDHLSVAEAYFYNRDITSDVNYSTVITDLKTKYGIA